MPVESTATNRLGSFPIPTQLDQRGSFTQEPMRFPKPTENLLQGIMRGLQAVLLTVQEIEDSHGSVSISRRWDAPSLARISSTRKRVTLKHLRCPLNDEGTQDIPQLGFHTHPSRGHVDCHLVHEDILNSPCQKQCQ